MDNLTNWYAARAIAARGIDDNARESEKPNILNSILPNKFPEERIIIPDRYTKKGQKRVISFPQRLMEILCKRDHKNVITWLPDGKSFKIIKPRVFGSQVLPMYFNQTKYSSFKRKLSRWGFKRDKAKEEAEKNDWFGSEIFHHENFQRDRLDLLDTMMCQGNKPSDPELVRLREESMRTGRMKEENKQKGHVNNAKQRQPRIEVEGTMPLYCPEVPTLIRSSVCPPAGLLKEASTGAVADEAGRRLLSSAMVASNSSTESEAISRIKTLLGFEAAANHQDKLRAMVLDAQLQRRAALEAEFIRVNSELERHVAETELDRYITKQIEAKTASERAKILQNMQQQEQQRNLETKIISAARRQQVLSSRLASFHGNSNIQPPSMAGQEMLSNTRVIAHQASIQQLPMADSVVAASVGALPRVAAGTNPFPDMRGGVQWNSLPQQVPRSRLNLLLNAVKGDGKEEDPINFQASEQNQSRYHRLPVSSRGGKSGRRKKF